MPRFKYQARNRVGEKVGGVMLANDEEQLAVTLREMDLYLVGAQPDRVSTPIYITRPVNRRELINFTTQLVTAIKAGIPILQALEDLESQTTNRAMKGAIQDIMQDLRGGASLSAAQSRHPHIFSEVYTSVTRAGEASGSLDKVLEHMIQFLEWQDALASEIKKATIYPAIVLSAVTILMGVLVGFVFPRMLPMIQSLNIPLPIVTRALLFTGEFVSAYWYLLLLGLVGLFILFRIFKSSEAGRFMVDAMKLRIPIIGNLIEMVCLSRFAHHVGTLMGTGIDITQTLSITERVVGNALIAQGIREAREKVNQGVSFWRALQETGVFPPLVIRMVFVGESSGSIDTSLERVTEYFDREIPTKVKRLFAVMEPLIVVVLAIMVLGVALSIFIPLYSVLGRIGGR